MFKFEMVYVVLPMRRMRTRCEEYMHPMYDDISNVSPYIYMTFKSDFACRACSSLMFSVSRLWEAVELLRLGVASNWFGLACPHHCGPATFPSLGLAFILGCICGFSSACFAIYHLLRPCPPVVHLCHPSAGLAIDRLRGYLNERGATT